MRGDELRDAGIAADGGLAGEFIGIILSGLTALSPSPPRARTGDQPGGAEEFTDQPIGGSILSTSRPLLSCGSKTSEI